jgi:ATPase subunit of ABC transporter with duplicated ATPase domains
LTRFSTTEAQARESQEAARMREWQGEQEAIQAEARRRERVADEIKRTTLDTQKHKEEAKAREKEMRGREEAKTAVSNPQEQEQQTENDLAIGIQAKVWFTPEEFQSAKTRIQYDPEKLHFAICGSSGSGKSSLINAFRGLKNSDPRAALTGVIETATYVNRYPDPHSELPYSRFIWFEVPGAGTLNIPGWQYFNKQGLFVFDVIILVYDTVNISLEHLKITAHIIHSVSPNLMWPS